LRRNALEEELVSHTDSITGLSLSHDGNYLLSTSIDQTVRSWDVRPYAVGDKCVKIYQGILHGMDRNLLRASWSASGKYVASGSSDK
jgi:Prp8 binding protein